jgi:hypothetical protein
VTARTVSDAVGIDAPLATRGTREGLYGRRKMTAYRPTAEPDGQPPRRGPADAGPDSYA